ncbi:MAG: hypothetical protein KA783_05360 [Chitinophagales bacterium]|jgi:NTP pyrophosphatase (non-canonical NTP hydrolase)|nr:hypothetical protein [Chitinophagales bacterium]
MTLDNLLTGLNQASSLIHQNNKAKGFWDKERNIGELLMLVTSELGEAMEAHRKSKFANWENYDKLRLQLGNNPNTLDTVSFEEHIKDTFEDEIADAVIRLLDLAAGLGIDLEKHVSSKVQYNETRPILHGKSY